MSHATVMVIQNPGSKKTIEDLMAPYDEQREVAPYISETVEELIKSGQGLVEYYKTSEEVMSIVNGMSKKDWIAKFANEFSNEDRKLGLYEAAKKKAKILKKELKGTMKEKDYYDLAIYKNDTLDAAGNRLSTYNPDSKWDWYVVGGRWSGSLILKDGSRADSALAEEIDWDAMYKLSPKAEKESRTFWRVYVEGKKAPKNMSEELKERLKFAFYKKEYYIKRYGSVDGYIKALATFETFAVLTGDGVWHEPGRMGWFACSTASEDDERKWTENYRSTFVDKLAPKSRITIVDYHI